MRKPRARTEAGSAAEIHKPDEKWREELTPQQYSVLRQGQHLSHYVEGDLGALACGLAGG